MSDASERLGALSAATLADLVVAVVTARWTGEWRIDVPPPSPDGSVDIRAEGEDGERLVRVRRPPASNPVGASEVEETAAFAAECGFESAAFVSTAGFADAAEAVEVPDLELVDPDRLVAWADAVDVPIPADDGGAGGTLGTPDGEDPTPPPLGSVLDRYATYWPEGLAERARAVSEAVAAAAPFDFGVSEGDASTEIECRLGGSAPVRLRFTETSFLVFVDGADGYDRVVALTVHRRNRPPASALVETVRASVAEALGGDGFEK